MHRCILIVALIMYASIGYSHDMGLGLVLFNPSNEAIVLNHNSKKDSIWWNSDSLLFQSSMLDGFEAYAEQKSPSILYFRLLEEKDDMMLIVFDERQQQKAWIKKGSHLEKMDWYSFITSFDVVEIGISTKLKVGPIESAEENEQVACGKFTVLQMKDDWIEIESFDCEVNFEKKDYGWVKWTDGKKLLVNRRRNE